MSTTLLSAPPITAAPASPADGHYYGYTEQRGWYPLYEEGGTFGLAAARRLKEAGAIVVPSVTGYISVIRKHQLEVYKMEQVAKACYSMDDADHAAGLEAYTDMAIATASGSSKGAMDLGTAIHHAAENAINGQEWDAQQAVYVDALMAEITNTGIKDSELKAEECMGSLKYGAAGKCDLNHAPSLTIGDIKTRGHKLNKVKASKVPYYETDLVQIAAYGFFKFGNRFFKDGRGIIFGVSTTKPGLVTPHIFAGKDLVQAFECFIAMTAVWRYTNNFDPRVNT